MEGWLTPYFTNTGRWGAPLLMPRQGARLAQNVSVSEAEGTFSVGSAESCAVVIDAEGWEPEHLRFSWDSRQGTWLVRNISSSPAALDAILLQPGKSEVLKMWEARISFADVSLHFIRRPAAPISGGLPAFEIPLKRGLVIGRGPAKDTADLRPRLELDRELRGGVSSLQAELEWRGKELYLINRNRVKTAYRTIHNGSQRFDEKKLVIGDCIQIPQCEYYTFKYTGKTLRHVGQGGVLQGESLSVDVKSGRILHEVSLDLPKGYFVGIIGGSGQGKSTLLNSLCGIVPATHGSVRVDGVLLRSPQDVASAGVGYVPQDDIVHKELRVIDALRYAAQLRIRATPAQLDDMLAAIMETLELSEHRDKRIHNLSGGQRKRVSIASELLASPEYLFLDEPTSGLDPQTEKLLMGALAKLARDRLMGVACTTHVLQNCSLMQRLVYISRGRLIFHGLPVQASRFFLQSGRSAGGTRLSVTRSSFGSVSESSVDSDAASSAAGSFGGSDRQAEKKSGDDYLLDKISLIYGRAQNTRTPPSAQDKVAEGWAEDYKKSDFFIPPSLPVPQGKTAPPHKSKSGVGMLRGLWVLLSRQSALLASAPLNYCFLLLQACAIGLMVGWVDSSPVLHMFLCVIATLWFGCSNGAQQIVGELAIFRRERLAGLGINTYLVAKFGFWTVITAIQALLLFGVVLVSSHVFHPDRLDDPAAAGSPADSDAASEAKNEARVAEMSAAAARLIAMDGASREFTKGFFGGQDLRWYRLVEESLDGNSPAESKPGGSPADFTIDGLDLPEAGQLPAKQVSFNPTGLKLGSGEYRLLERLAWFFRVRPNIENALGVRSVSTQEMEQRKLLGIWEGSVSWRRFMLELVGIRFFALLLAAGVGVGLGLMVSALVQTPTQAVMWVPLILIPQILFGAFVVTIPDMSKGVLQLSRLLPSYNLQRIMDVGLLQGRVITDMTDDSKVPSFKARSPYDVEKVVSADGSITNYDRVSEVNESWQNLVVDREKLGQRHPIEGKSSVSQREDVLLKGARTEPGGITLPAERYDNLEPGKIAAAALGGWIGASYLIALISLIRRQTGR